MNGNEDVIARMRFEAMKREILRKILTKEAFERLSRIKFVNPELANQLELYLVQLYQSGQIKDIITDKKMKEILLSLQSKKDFRIRRL